MAKFYGKVGYADTVETKPGVWTPTVTERTYSGDVLRSSTSWKAGENLNDDLTISNQISIVADPFAYQNSFAMKYVKWMGAAWKIDKIDIHRPRLILTLGGVYNGEQAPTG